MHLYTSTKTLFYIKSRNVDVEFCQGLNDKHKSNANAVVITCHLNFVFAYCLYALLS